MVRTDIILVVIVFGLFLCAGQLPAQTIQVTDRDCAALVAHQPSADAAYKPGVDVKGRRVVSADLGGASRITVPKELRIPISVDLQKKLGIPHDPSQFQTGDFVVGTVAWKNNRAYFNGQPLRDDAAARLAALCQARKQAPLP